MLLILVLLLAYTDNYSTLDLLYEALYKTIVKKFEMLLFFAYLVAHFIKRAHQYQTGF